MHNLEDLPTLIRLDIFVCGAKHFLIVQRKKGWGAKVDLIPTLLSTCFRQKITCIITWCGEVGECGGVGGWWFIYSKERDALVDSTRPLGSSAPSGNNLGHYSVLAQSVGYSSLMWSGATIIVFFKNCLVVCELNPNYTTKKQTLF